MPVIFEFAFFEDMYGACGPFVWIDSALQTCFLCQFIPGGDKHLYRFIHKPLLDFHTLYNIYVGQDHRVIAAFKKQLFGPVCWNWPLTLLILPQFLRFYDVISVYWLFLRSPLWLCSVKYTKLNTFTDLLKDVKIVPDPVCRLKSDFSPLLLVNLLDSFYQNQFILQLARLINWTPLLQFSTRYSEVNPFQHSRPPLPA